MTVEIKTAANGQDITARGNVCQDSIGAGMRIQRFTACEDVQAFSMCGQEITDLPDSDWERIEDELIDAASEAAEDEYWDRGEALADRRRDNDA